MGTLLRAGGLGTWVVILFGGIALISSIVLVARRDAGKLALVRAMTWATVFAAIAAVTANVTAVLWKVPAREEWASSPDLPLIVMQGLGEALTPAILGSSLLAVSWFLVAVGTRRQQDPIE